MSLGIKVRVNKTRTVYDVYAIICKRDDKQKIYLIKGLSGATRTSFLVRTDSYLLLNLSPDMNPEDKISEDYKWLYEKEVTVLQPETNDKALPFLLKETW